jgi:hypothetical protein
MSHIVLMSDGKPHPVPGGRQAGHMPPPRPRPDRAPDPFGPATAALGALTWLLLVAIAATAPLFW